jgi:hypothetical protein
LAFGGKNPETCRAPDLFLDLDTKWTSSDILNRGHKITKIKLVGKLVTNQKKIPIDIGDDCGSFVLIRSKKNSHRQIILNQRYVEEASITRSFNNIDEFENLLKFIRTNPLLNELKWYVKQINSESTQTKDQCVWKRKSAGDGTKRMVLLLQKLNGINFTECMRKDLYDAADEMFYAPCERLTGKKATAPTQDICFLAAEDGTVDISNMVAAA